MSDYIEAGPFLVRLPGDDFNPAHEQHAVLVGPVDPVRSSHRGMVQTHTPGHGLRTFVPMTRAEWRTFVEVVKSGALDLAD